MTNGIRTATFAKYIPDPLQLQSNSYEPNQLDEDMSTSIHVLALVDNTEPHFLFLLANVQGETLHPSRTPPSAVCYHKKLLLPTGTSKIDICTRPTYQCRVSLEISDAAMYILQRLSDTEAGLYLASMTPIP